jgi:hypothetical protein
VRLKELGQLKNPMISFWNRTRDLPEVVVAEFEVLTRNLLKGMNKAMKYNKLSGFWSEV